MDTALISALYWIHILLLHYQNSMFFTCSGNKWPVHRLMADWRWSHWICGGVLNFVSINPQLILRSFQLSSNPLVEGQFEGGIMATAYFGEEDDLLTCAEFPVCTTFKHLIGNLKRLGWYFEVLDFITFVFSSLTNFLVFFYFSLTGPSLNCAQQNLFKFYFL